jgi:hypothetical protein
MSDVWRMELVWRLDVFGDLCPIEVQFRRNNLILTFDMHMGEPASVRMNSKLHKPTGFWSHSKLLDLAEWCVKHSSTCHCIIVTQFDECPGTYCK